MAKITPFNAVGGDLTGMTLIIGCEGTGKHEIAKCLVDMGVTVGLKVHTCCTLPLPEESPVSKMNVPFICFVMHISNKESFKTLLHCIGKVDITYFLGRSAIIVNTSGMSTEEAVPHSHITSIGSQYGVPVLFRNIKNPDERADLGRTLMRMIETAMGHFSNVSPLLYDAVHSDGQFFSGDKSSAVARPASRTETVGLS